MTFAELYPPRPRATNVELIRALRDATSQEEFNAANAASAAALHPSLIAELDWMEMTMPPAHVEQGRRFVDGFFLDHLPTLLSMRRVELDLDDAALGLEVAGNEEFYRYLADEMPEAVGESLRGRLGEALADFERRGDELLERIAERERELLRGEVSEVVSHRQWIVGRSSVAIRNLVAQALDRPSSRSRAKAFLRAGGGMLPTLEAPDADDAAALAGELRALAAAASEYRLLRLVAFCESVADQVAALDEPASESFLGERAEGYGHCNRCSMMFSSSAMVSLDPTCPGLFEGAKGAISLPLDFNVATCPFCGHEDRIDSPAMFYSSERNQVLYNLPTLGQLTPEQSLEVHRPIIEQIRQRYIARVGEEERRAFEGAREEIVHSCAELMTAIHMGTTVPEEHVCNVVRLADGHGMLVDTTKNVIMVLTPGELASRWAADLPVDAGVGASAGSAAPEPEPGETLEAAMSAFEGGSYERARDILEVLHRREPSNVTRRNLAAAHYAAGDRAAARAVLRS